jgi:hypothetical protein
MVIVSSCITALLGLFLLSVWAHERIRALAWWGSARPTERSIAQKPTVATG